MYVVIVMKQLVSISENDVLPSSSFTAFFTSLRAATSIFKFIYSTLIYLYLYLYLYSYISISTYLYMRSVQKISSYVDKK